MSDVGTESFLYEDDVVRATMRYLVARGWTIESFCLAHQRGDDIVATRSGERLIVEAKGAGSSKEGTKRFGQAFDGKQVGTHVAVAVHRALGVWSGGAAFAGLAFPDNAHHRSKVAPVLPALAELGITVFWVSAEGQASAEPALV